MSHHPIIIDEKASDPGPKVKETEPLDQEQAWSRVMKELRSSYEQCRMGISHFTSTRGEGAFFEHETIAKKLTEFSAVKAQLEGAIRFGEQGPQNTPENAGFEQIDPSISRMQRGG